MNSDAVFRRYQDLQAYVGWTSEDAQRVAGLAPLVEPHLPALIEDFYAEIERHPQANKVITGGSAQIERLKGTLLLWLRQLFAGNYDADYVIRRWRVGWRHVEIGLDQVYTNAALSRLRSGLMAALRDYWTSHPEEMRALNVILDLDLAIIEDAYQAEHLERQRALDKARNEAAFVTLVEAAPCLVVILRPDHSILYLNRFAEELTGHQAEQVSGLNFATAILTDEVRLTPKDDLERILSHAVQWPVRCRDGTHRWVLWTARRLEHHAGGPAVLAVGQDVSELKLAQERTLQAERLAAIGQMVTGLAHESGNALARSQACLEMLELELADRPEAMELVERIQKAQNHLQQLYDEVRNYAAPVKLERESSRLASIWRQAWSNLAVKRQDRQAALIEECADTNVRCAVDAFRLEQVFRNVFENSLAACRDPVEITVRCSDTLMGGKPAVFLAIRDNGPGLTPEQRHRIFEPFFTTKTKGTGLGMAIARRTVEAHGGRIAVGPGPGAEIQITLPREETC